MKTKIITFAMIIALCPFAKNIQAQIVMHESGQISLQESTDDWEKGIQVFQRGVVFFNTRQTHDFHWVTAATPANLTGKCWIVTSPTSKYTHNFYVEGDGDVYRTGGCYQRIINSPGPGEMVTGSGDIINGINGVYYNPTDENSGTRKEDRRIGVHAEEVEKVLPEAVTRDENNLLYVDYNALTVVLIEAYKEQKAEIELLRKTLEEHGLLKPEK